MPTETPHLPYDTHSRLLRRGETTSRLLADEVAEFPRPSSIWRAVLFHLTAIALGCAVASAILLWEQLP